MVKIPELAKDRQNWKIYHAKFLKVTATYDCLEVPAGRPYKGDNWDVCNALLCYTFMESIPPSIYFQHLCYTAHENFKFLAKRFHDNEPIPTQTNSNKVAQLQQQKHQRTILQAQMQPQNGMQMQNRIMKTYLLLKT